VNVFVGGGQPGGGNVRFVKKGAKVNPEAVRYSHKPAGETWTTDVGPKGMLERQRESAFATSAFDQILEIYSFKWELQEVFRIQPGEVESATVASPVVVVFLVCCVAFVCAREEGALFFMLEVTSSILWMTKLARWDSPMPISAHFGFDSRRSCSVIK
jgi:hypothetical protein